jgi:hypothetical protein
MIEMVTCPTCRGERMIQIAPGCDRMCPQCGADGVVPARPAITPDLLEYTRRFLTLNQVRWLIPERPIRHFGVVTTIVLHRQGQYQTELVIALPETDRWPGEHRHPHVDSIEVAVWDCDDLTRNGVPVRVPDLIYRGRGLVHLLPTDWHGSKATEHGISLLSCQHWIDREPSSVGLDWEGQPVHAAHHELIEGTLDSAPPRDTNES